MSQSSTVGMLHFAEEIGNLKHLNRRGWILRGIPNPERITGHMYRMALLAMAMDPIDNCDMDKVVKLCLLHDLPECRVGDITPHCGVDVKTKHQMEEQAMKEIASLLPPGKGQKLMTLYEEYEERESIESIVTKELDLLDLMIQAFEYERKIFLSEGALPDLEEFFGNHREKIQLPELVGIRDELLKRREEFMKTAILPAKAGVSNGTLTNGHDLLVYTEKNPLRSNGYMNILDEVIGKAISS